MKIRQVLVLFVLALLARPAFVQGQVLTAEITYPANGAANADLTQPIHWTSVPNVQVYYLYVGTTVGAKDLVNTGETTQTSYLAPYLPVGQTLYARMWTKVGGVWRYVDSTFTAAAALTAVITYPANGAVNANMSQPIQWTSVPNVQTYYLYVGTTVGAKDLVNTGETLQTSYQPSNLPAGQTLYARMWTKVGGVWRYVDSTFTAASSAPLSATLTYPANGAVNANLAQPITWTSVANVQTYYLYVGTTVGAKDLVNTGEIQQTSFLAAGLPVGQTVYARIWTKVGGVWRYNDSTFSAAASAPVTATITYPANGAVNASMAQPITWTTIANVQAYYLYVGTTVGAKNLIDTGETQQTSYLVNTDLPVGTTLYARMWTRVSGVWRYVDSSFSVTNARATLTYPANGAADVDQTQPATWTSVANVQTYYLYVGTTPGAKDLIDSQETLSTTFPIAGLPAGQTLYARLWTKAGGVWRYRDSTFTASVLAPEFIYPTDGALGVTTAQPFQWTSPVNAQAHQLRVGTSPGGNDAFDSGEIATPSVAVSGLPATGTLYARAMSRVNGVWHHTDIAFTPDASSPIATILDPVDGAPNFDTSHAFEWEPAPFGRGYRLTIGTTAGGNDLHDSGEIHVTRRFVPSLPLGTLFGRLQTKVRGQWYATDFTFSVVANTVSAVPQIKSAVWATDVVRSMARSDNRPFTWTELAAQTLPRFDGVCSDYALTLLQVLSEMNVQLQARRLDVGFNPGGYDVHTLVEMLDPDTNSWMLLDPTFDLTVRRANGDFATAENVSDAARNQQWSDLSYEFLGTLDDYYARSYYLDHPLLFVNVYHEGQQQQAGQGAPILQYMLPVTTPVSGPYDIYAVGCTGSQTATLRVDGVDRVINCGGVDGLSSMFGATTVETTSETAPSVVVYRPRRYMF